MSYGWRLPQDETFVQRIRRVVSEKHEFNSTAATLLGHASAGPGVGPLRGYS